jgi:ribose-phosphate pyrophosphokinase
MIIIPGPASLMLGEKIAKELGVKSCKVEHKFFPDGESYIRLKGDLKGETVVMIQTTAPNPNTRLMQLIQIASISKNLGAHKLIAVTPYLAYSRQDKRFLEGEALTLDIILGLLDKSGIDDLIVVDAHNENSIQKIVEKYDIIVHNLSAIPQLAGYMKRVSYAGAYSLSPDLGALNLANAAAKVLGGGYGFFEKERNLITGEIEMHLKELNIEGEKAIVFDDIISSGGTMAKAIKRIKDQGASKVAAACTHALFVNNAEKKIKEAGADLIIASDTIQTKYSKVTIAGIMADFLQLLD